VVLLGKKLPLLSA